MIKSKRVLPALGFAALLALNLGLATTESVRANDCFDGPGNGGKVSGPWGTGFWCTNDEECTEAECNCGQLSTYDFYDRNCGDQPLCQGICTWS